MNCLPVILHGARDLNNAEYPAEWFNKSTQNLIITVVCNIAFPVENVYLYHITATYYLHSGTWHGIFGVRVCTNTPHVRLYLHVSLIAYNKTGTFLRPE